MPYIPWHLTTQEFFGEVKAHLEEDGVMAMNVGRAPDDRRLVDAITATLLTVFPTVHAIDVPGSFNTIFGSDRAAHNGSEFDRKYGQLDGDVDPLLQGGGGNGRVPTSSPQPLDVIFTDERAPVETIIDSLVLRYLLQEGVAGLPGLG